MTAMTAENAAGTASGSPVWNAARSALGLSLLWVAAAGCQPRASTAPPAQPPTKVAQPLPDDLEQLKELYTSPGDWQRRSEALDKWRSLQDAGDVGVCAAAAEARAEHVAPHLRTGVERYEMLAGDLVHWAAAIDESDSANGLRLARFLLDGLDGFEPHFSMRLADDAESLGALSEHLLSDRSDWAVHRGAARLYLAALLFDKVIAATSDERSEKQMELRTARARAHGQLAARLAQSSDDDELLERSWARAESHWSELSSWPVKDSPHSLGDAEKVRADRDAVWELLVTAEPDLLDSVRGAKLSTFSADDQAAFAKPVPQRSPEENQSATAVATALADLSLADYLQVVDQDERVELVKKWFALGATVEQITAAQRAIGYDDWLPRCQVEKTAECREARVKLRAATDALVASDSDVEERSKLCNAAFDAWARVLETHDQARRVRMLRDEILNAVKAYEALCLGGRPLPSASPLKNQIEIWRFEEPR
ncbi:MAG: hypothetical protein QF805_16420 [Pirellulaceae bacterium]|nr:hypothetical protein [Pirellulaceae bacterium]